MAFRYEWEYSEQPDAFIWYGMALKLGIHSTIPFRVYMQQITKAETLSAVGVSLGLSH
jgi:hypothetical protein